MRCRGAAVARRPERCGPSGGSTPVSSTPAPFVKGKDPAEIGSHAEIVKDIGADHTGRRMFSFRDPDGYVIGVNEKASLEASDLGKGGKPPLPLAHRAAPPAPATEPT